MASVAKLPVGEARRETRDLTTVVLYFLVFPLCVSLGETLLQFPIATRDSLVLSFAFAAAFTVPGTFFAWAATMGIARLPGARRLPVVVLLIAGYALSITIFSPYNRYVHEVASQVLPHMREVATVRHESSGWWQVAVIMGALRSGRSNGSSGAHSWGRTAVLSSVSRRGATAIARGGRA